MPRQERQPGRRSPGPGRAAGRPRSSRRTGTRRGSARGTGRNPMISASARLRSLSPRSCLAARSASSITPPQTISAKATTHRLRSGPAIRSLARKPTTHDRQRPDDHQPGEPVVGSVRALGVEQAAAPGADEHHDVAPEVDDHGDDRADLDDRGERGDAGSSMGRPSIFSAMVRCPVRGDREELGEALDDAEDDGLDRRSRGGLRSAPRRASTVRRVLISASRSASKQVTLTRGDARRRRAGAADRRSGPGRRAGEVRSMNSNGTAAAAPA